MSKYNISRGHSDKCIGADDILSEIKEAEKVLNATSSAFKSAGHSVRTLIDRTSTTQNQNLTKIVNWHNASPANLEISVHLNAGGGTGCEVWYYAGDSKGKKYATAVSAEMAKALGLPNRGAKATKDLRFLNSTKHTAILLEICFVDRKEDANAIHKLGMYEKIGNAIVKGVTGKTVEPKNPNRHEGKVVDSAPLLPKMDFKSNPVRMYKAGTKFLVYEHNKYWYKAYINNKLYYMYKSFCVVAGKKDSKGRLPVRIKSAKDLRIPVWNNTRLNSGKIKWYKPGTKLAWYDNKKGYLELWYTKDGWYYTANYFLK
ncbi:N-acetylmuramoyl-L-alanine amidase [Listeria monocytogenes]|uniref:N-acetylmuramoyl-L-alanine amidase n=1 Tax=Listeria seeligeri TaxID=1640 RepID=UPI0010E8214A|nr:N-acetylmuramoyl-L-alanine amidase [Listeria seeligeri]EAC7899171.1 N-acetylmuramoyl-L-alanine amidase [Listeria monocytogenes]EKZ0898506.1 N-acetylmuramoyl-L-alanine amidase [Listeria monocytogenes]MBC6130561.1 N-acetylmuramoyl-L-alanine amidase [Listeria seeligeri]HAA4780960.1 N-acetylmuramoyl-L-alanine amidase [Listeria monocytogenes]HAC5329116.1 N-acetylmuramoyl-L-alanine amidase [Listeria monocytogenes]